MVSERDDTKLTKKGTVMTSDVEQAERTLATLRQKREQLIARGHSLGEDAGKISYSAHTGDGQTRKRLDKLNAEIALHDSELRSLDAAIAEAAARVQQAQAAEAQVADRQTAEEARKLVRELAECFAYVDKHLAAAADGLITVERGFAQLRGLGLTHPTDVQVRLGVVTCIHTWAMRLPRNWHSELRDGLRFLAPHERKTFTSYWQAIEAMLQNSIRQRTGEAERADTEAA
jgi:hypothetical protein